MNVTQIEEIVKKLALDVINNSVEKDQFIYELMAAYGHRKTTVSRIKSGERNLAKVAGEVRAKRHIYFKHSDSNEVFSDIDDMKKEPSVTREKIRFIIATDFNHFVAVDTRTHDTLDIELSELGKHFDFFLPWAGMEKAVYQGDNPADVKAAEKMAKLFDLIKADNFNEENKNDTAALHSLNVFLTRLLFCFFAEDTGIFTDNQFSSELESHTKADGSDVDSYLNRLFEVLNTSKEDRHDLPDYLAKFEYVNGGLFSDAIDSPRFSTKSRRMLIECGSELDWSGINPDIFGSMIQAVVHPDQRGGMGMHYTSVINIMKVIEPLFLDDLYAELENIAKNIDAKLKPSRLRKLHDRIANIKIFDPACGSGNFLIIAFKELRKLEMEIIKQLQELKKNENQDDFFDEFGLDSSFSRIKLPQFYGIELDDFAHEVAILSLWLAEHQMNIEFKAEFGECEPALPLRQSGNIVPGNALRMEWEDICSNRYKEEVYVIGNPPYIGESKQNASQKSDMAYVFKGKKNYKKQDYISCWFLKVSEYICENTKAAFVSTSSVTQGIQVGMLWPHCFNNGTEIIFAYKPFEWKNSAKDNAGVYCVIVGLGIISKSSKKIFSDTHIRVVKSISPYLVEGESKAVIKVSRPLFDLPIAMKGNGVYDGGYFMFTPEEKKDVISEFPESSKFLKKVTGSKEFISNTERWCIWINENDLSEAKSIPFIDKRIEKVKKWRENSGETAQAYANVPYRFKGINKAKRNLMIIPAVSACSRDYIPMGFLDAETIVTDLAFMILDPDIYVFSILNSSLHQLWVRTVTGRLGDGYRYSLGVCYNSFPTPVFSESNKNELRLSALNILEAREKHSDKNLFQLYSKGKMPEDLLIAHIENDKLVERIYGYSGFTEDQLLENLFATYFTEQERCNA